MSGTSLSMLYDNAVEITSKNPEVIVNMDKIICAPKFINFMNSLDHTTIIIKKIEIFNATWFCAPHMIAPEKLGFLYLNVICTDKDNTPLPGIVFLRGSAVAVLIIVEVDGKEYVLLTKQIRVPIGKTFLEIPAGMLDGSGNFAGKMADEIREETSLVVNVNELCQLGEPIYPSPGGCDEAIQLYLWKTSITSEKMQELLNKIHGNIDEHEKINLAFIPLQEFDQQLSSQISDVKAICARLRSYQILGY